MIHAQWCTVGSVIYHWMCWWAVQKGPHWQMEVRGNDTMKIRDLKRERSHSVSLNLKKYTVHNAPQCQNTFSVFMGNVSYRLLLLHVLLHEMHCCGLSCFARCFLWPHLDCVFMYRHIHRRTETKQIHMLFCSATEPYGAWQYTIDKWRSSLRKEQHNSGKLA